VAHENSETIKGPDGRWINVYGGSKRPLPKKYPYEQDAYDSVEDAVRAARRRSQDEGKAGAPKGPAPAGPRSAAPLPPIALNPEPAAGRIEPLTQPLPRPRPTPQGSRKAESAPEAGAEIPRPSGGFGFQPPRRARGLTEEE
jgi:hypothetical protein